MANRKHVMLILAIVVVLLLSACGTAGSTTSQTPLQVLQKSLTAMQQLNAVHFAMKSTTNVDWGRTSTSSTSQPSTITITANGDLLKPNKDSIHLSLGQAYSLSEITLGKQVYIQNMQGQWYVLDASKFKQSGSDPFASTSADNFNKLLAIAQKATYTDHGIQTLNGQSLRHITVIFNKDALRDLLTASGQANTLPAQQKQNLDTLLTNIKLVNPILDVWIDESTSYVHHMELIFDMTIDTSSFKTATPTANSASSSHTANVDMTIDYNNFNVPVTITAPSKAIPTDNLSPVFGFGAGRN